MLNLDIFLTGNELDGEDTNSQVNQYGVGGVEG